MNNFNQLVDRLNSIFGTTNVYFRRPSTEVRYPFVDFGDIVDDYTETKTEYVRKKAYTLNVWALSFDECDELTSQIIQTLINEMDVDYSSVEKKIIVDDTTSDLLFHGVISVRLFE